MFAVFIVQFNTIWKQFKLRTSKQLLIKNHEPQIKFRHSYKRKKVYSAVSPGCGCRIVNFSNITRHSWLFRQQTTDAYKTDIRCLLKKTSFLKNKETRFFDFLHINCRWALQFLYLRWLLNNCTTRRRVGERALGWRRRKNPPSPLNLSPSIK